MKRYVQREFRFDASESKTLCTDRSSHRGNREISAVPSGDYSPTGRSEKAVGGTSDMHAAEKSDDLVVPAKRTNKAETSVAESVEERGSAKGNVNRIRLIRTQSRKSERLSERRTASKVASATDRHTQSKSRMR